MPRTSTYWASPTGLPLSSDSICGELLGVRLRRLRPARASAARARRRRQRGPRPSSNASRAAATARSTSSAPACATCAISRPLAGSSVANVRPSAASRRSAPISSRCGPREELTRGGRRARRAGRVGVSAAAVMAESVCGAISLRLEDDLHAPRAGHTERTPPAASSRLMWCVTSGVGSSRPADIIASTWSTWADHVGVAGAHAQRLDPDQPHVHLAALGVDADRLNGAALARQADRELQRARVADGVDAERRRRAPRSPRARRRADRPRSGAPPARRRTRPSPGARARCRSRSRARRRRRARPARRTARRGPGRARPRRRRRCSPQSATAW